ncbi:sphingosine-1-phosphate phosphatase 2-like [Microplitis mediator]|uniref:sphingosine-1-phosphate phosphatase 2-like n=1 Tax=Microplitis mediator TaxID=375433 RepID=UPI0025566B50|nr:sphingosine-1-phosphate phosphatase 2-like [Microplitis mediator]
MMNSFINYLKEPELVAEIQKFFGVEYEENLNLKKKNINNGRSKINCNEDTNGCLLRNDINLCDIRDEKNKYCKNLYKDDNYDDDGHEITKGEKLTIINNYYWYYLFLFSTELGDEIFYTTFIPFMFWNIDALVGRRVVLVWGIIMTIGQVLKDIIRWPRPACPPAIRLQNKWSQEYGMPSTHAAISVAIPFSILIFTINRYSYSVPLGLIIVTTWCTLICLSRLYLGMHTVLDIIAGLLLAIGLMIVLVPIVRTIDYYLVTNFIAVVIFIIICVLTIVYYPCSDRWTPTRGDSAMVVAVTSGIHFGAWLNYKTGLILPLIESPPYQINLPSYQTLLVILIRTFLGFSIIVLSKIIIKKITYRVICGLLNLDADVLMKSENSLENRWKIITDLTYKFIFCFIFGVLTIHYLPQLFSAMGIGRKEFYYEF